MYKAVFFDFYQTLVGYDPPREEVESRILDELGIKAASSLFGKPFAKADEYFYQENAAKPMSKRTKEEEHAVYARHQAILLKEAGFEPERELIKQVLLRLRDQKYKLKLFDDVMPIVNLLKPDYILGLVSNVDRDIRPDLKELGLTSLLSVVITSRETGFAKPQPLIFLEAARQAGLDPGEVVFVGDQINIDIIGAHRAGMRAALIDRLGMYPSDSSYDRIDSLARLSLILG